MVSYNLINFARVSQWSGRNEMDSIILLGLVVRRVDNFIQRINPCPVDKICSLSNQNLECVHFIHPIRIYPLDKVIHSSYNQAQFINWFGRSMFSSNSL